MTRTMQTPTVKADVGILVGRWQVHELHEAHVELIDTVRSLHDRVIIFCGLSPLRNTVANPLDFDARKRMILEKYPHMEVYYVEDHPDDVVWSKTLDALIDRWLKPYQTCILYGSRDSFLQYYHGRNATCELEAKRFISGTEMRRRITNSFPSSPAFRAGMIAASLNRYVAVLPTVDIAILSEDRSKVLMGRKHTDSGVRFIGGFSSTNSPTYEADARREVMEETHVEIGDLTYIGSALIDDWRYKKEQDKIKTMLFAAPYVFGRPQADDDVAFVEWVKVSDLLTNTVPVIPEHLPLVELLGIALAKGKV
jgi:bifunctional NMN adenylyltransferase/nudix hydrolase